MQAVSVKSYLNIPHNHLNLYQIHIFKVCKCYYWFKLLSFVTIKFVETLLQHVFALQLTNTNMTVGWLHIDP